MFSFVDGMGLVCVGVVRRVGVGARDSKGDPGREGTSQYARGKVSERGWSSQE